MGYYSAAATGGDGTWHEDDESASRRRHPSALGMRTASLEVRSALGPGYVPARPITSDTEHPAWVESGQPFGYGYAGYHDERLKRERAERTERDEAGTVLVHPVPKDSGPAATLRANVSHLAPIVAEARRVLAQGDPEARRRWPWPSSRRRQPETEPIEPPPGYHPLPLDDLTEIVNACSDLRLFGDLDEPEWFAFPATAITKRPYRARALSQYPDLDPGRCVQVLVAPRPPHRGEPRDPARDPFELMKATAIDLSCWWVNEEGMTWLWGEPWPPKPAKDASLPPPALSERVIRAMCDTSRGIEADMRARGIDLRRCPMPYWIDRETGTKVTGMVPKQPELYVFWHAGVEDPYDFEQRIRAQL